MSPLDGGVMVGSFDYLTMALSALIAVLASYTALNLAERVSAASGVARVAWLIGGGAVIGTGIWSVYYTGMLAFRLPVPVLYHWPTVLLSLVVVWAASAAALFAVCRERLGWRAACAGGIFLGAGIAGLHYTAMAAIRLPAPVPVPDLSHALGVTSFGMAGIVTVMVLVQAGGAVTVLVDRLRKRDAVFEELFEQAPAGALLGVDCRVIRVNREFTNLFGYTQPEAWGRRLDELIVPGESADEFQRCWELVSHGRRVDVEAVRRRKDGGLLQVLIVEVLLSAPGRRVTVGAMYRDITERKAAEAAMQALSTRLLEVQENERKHLARELHDEIGQSLTGLHLLLRRNGDLPDVEARAVVDDLLGRVRRLSFDLRPASLDELGLIPALLALFERYAAQTGVLVDFKHQDAERRLAPQVEIGVYRIVQEALTNAARHAGVTHVTVRLWTDADSFNLKIEDRGRGFDPKIALQATRSSGLAGMRERAMLLGGRITIESSAGSGTTITAGLPLDTTSATGPLT